MSVYALTWLVVVLPIAFCVLAYVSEVPRRAAQISMLGTAAALVLSLVVLVDRIIHSSQNPYLSVITFFTYAAGQQPQGSIADFHPQVGVLVDGLSAAVMPLVALTSLLAQFHATAYMRRDRGYRRLFALIGVTTFAMEALVASPNLFQTLAMWILLGIGGCLLVAHWWEREAAVAAARRALLITGLGDLALFLAVVIGFVRLAPDIEGLPRVAGQDVNDPFNFQLLTGEWGRVSGHHVLGVGGRTLAVLGALVLIAVVVRSALVPFHAWLLSAMDGPTPVSALLHSGPMLGAGVYLLVRTEPLLLVVPHLLTAVALIGAVSAVAGAAAALAARDLKRLVALLSVSQLGLAFVALGVGAVSAAVLQLLVAGATQALLLLAGGNLIAAYRTQDVDEMGGAWRRMRGSATALLLGCAAAAGVLPLAGFWARGAVLGAVLRDHLPGGGHVSVGAQVVLVVGVAGALLLAGVAATRLFIVVALGEPRRRRGFSPERVRDAEPAMRVPVLVLGALVAVVGLLGIEGSHVSLAGLLDAAGGVGAGESRGGTSWAIGLLLSGLLGLLGAGLGWVAWGASRRVVERPPVLVARLRTILAALPPDAHVWGVVGAAVRRAARLPVGADARIGELGVDAAAEAVSLLGAGAHRLRRGRLGLSLASAVAGVAVAGALITLAATGHLPGVGGAR